jgi:hypothetical protein
VAVLLKPRRLIASGISKTRKQQCNARRTSIQAAKGGNYAGLRPDRHAGANSLTIPVWYR